MPEFEISFSGVIYVDFEDEDQAEREWQFYVDGKDCILDEIQKVATKTEEQA